MNLYFFIIIGPLGIKRKLLTIEYIFFLTIFFGLDFYNHKLYKGRFEEFDKKWGNEPKINKILGMIKVMAFIILCWGFFLITAWIYDRKGSF